MIFILMDDMGYSDVSCYGAKKVNTPNIDRMAKEGLKFFVNSECAVGISHRRLHLAVICRCDIADSSEIMSMRKNLET